MASPYNTMDSSLQRLDQEQLTLQDSSNSHIPYSFSSHYLKLVSHRDCPSFLLCTSCVFYTFLFFILFLFFRQQTIRLRAILLFTTATFPIFALTIHDEKILLFTSSIAGLLCVITTDSLVEIVTTHLAHSLCAYLVVVGKFHSSEKDSIDLTGWKINFIASILWIFAYSTIQRQKKALSAKSSWLLLSLKELIRRNKELEGCLKDKEEFLISFSHEFKNLLNILLGNLDLAARATTSQSSNYLRSALVSGEVMRNMVFNVLDSGKYAQVANLEIKSQRTHLPSFLESVWSLCAELIASKSKLNGRILLSPQVPHYVLLDPQRILQVFLNLITNAVKFTERGAITIKVQWEQAEPGRNPKKSTETLPTTVDRASLLEDPASFDAVLTQEKLEDEEIRINETKGFLQSDPHFHELNLINREWSKNFGCQAQSAGTKGILKISIQDTGSGMSEEQVNKLFQKFSQVSDDQSKRKLGTGIGLWITKQIIEKHNGIIEIDSKERVGSRFDIFIPTVVEDTVDNPSIEILQDNCFYPGRFSNSSRGKTSRASISQVNFNRNSLNKGAFASSARNAEASETLNTILQEKQANSTTSLDVPVSNRNPFNHPMSMKNSSKILIVDDDAFNLEVLGKYVEEFVGSEKIVYAKSTREVFNLIETNQIEDIKLAFIDKNLGDGTGVKAIAELKDAAHAKGHEPMVCFLTSGENKAQLDKDLQNFDFIDGYLVKPIEIEELQRTIVHYFFK